MDCLLVPEDQVAKHCIKGLKEHIMHLSPCEIAVSTMSRWESITETCTRLHALSPSRHLQVLLFPCN